MEDLFHFNYWDFTLVCKEIRITAILGGVEIGVKC